MSEYQQKSEQHNHDYLFGAHSLSYQLGEKDISFFCQYYLQDYFLPKDTNTVRPLAPLHFDIWAELEDIFLHNKRDKQLFILPRGSAKTTIIDMALSVWLHVYRKSIYSIVLANRELDAINFVDQTRKALNSPYLINTFGELVQPKQRTVNKLELELINDTKISAYSSGSSVRGASYVSPQGIYRPTAYIADDYISEQDILTDDAKQKKYVRWLKEIEEGGDEAVYRNGQLIKPATKFIVLGTPLAKGDFIDQLKANPEYKTYQKGVVDFDVDEYFEQNEYWQQFKSIYFDSTLDDPEAEAKQYYQDNTDQMEFPTIWDKFNPLNLAIRYFNKRIAFMQELMCNIENVGDKWFKSNRIMSANEMNELEFENTLLAIDTAGVKNKNKAASDYFAFTFGSTYNGFKYVRKAELHKFYDFDEYINKVIDYLLEYEELATIYIEKNTYTGLDVERIQTKISEHSELKRRNITFINEMQRKNKDEKISTIVSDVNNGRVIFCSELVDDEFLQQVMSFQGQKYSAHDDAADSLAEFVTRIDELDEQTPKIKVSPSSLLF
ncbi:hypothetical protein [Salsuginibacillus kocurii]|uniref:hypothetical protein n=1 Tax=Salsuginibacillus kocurii TaxID=427078 RepID=UPI0003640A5B|nr:hypothetical protein [Salsuginibacillus kocurii]